MSTTVRKYHPEEHSKLSRKFRVWKIRFKLWRLGLGGDPATARANLESVNTQYAIKRRVRRKLQK